MLIKQKSYKLVCVGPKGGRHELTFSEANLKEHGLQEGQTISIEQLIVCLQYKIAEDQKFVSELLKALNKMNTSQEGKLKLVVDNT